MDASEIITALQAKWKNGSTTDTNFNNAMLNAINQGLEKICLQHDFWFLQNIGTLTTISGTATYKIGNPAPTTGLTGTTTAIVGLPTGTYTYKVTYINPWGESNPSPLSNTVVTGGLFQIALTNIPVAPTGQVVTARRIWRNATGGTVWYLLATLNDNTTTTYTDNVADAALILQATCPSAHLIKPMTYLYQTSSPARVKVLGQDSFRRFVPSATATGKPIFGFVYGDNLVLYPTPDNTYPIYYPYYFRWKKIRYTNDVLPEALPGGLLFDYAESEYLMMNNKENRFYYEALEKFKMGLGQLMDDHFRHVPPIQIISEDEEAVDWEEFWPQADYLNGG